MDEFPCVELSVGRDLFSNSLQNAVTELRVGVVHSFIPRMASFSPGDNLDSAPMSYDFDASVWLVADDKVILLQSQ